MPFPVERFRFNTDNSSPSGSVALAKRSDFLIIKLLSSSTELRFTGPVNSGASFTGLTFIDAFVLTGSSIFNSAIPLSFKLLWSNAGSLYQSFHFPLN